MNFENDWFLHAIAETILKEEEGIAVSNPVREKEFSTCEETIKKMFAGTGAKISISPHSDLPSVGNIEVRADRLDILDPFLFAKAASLAHNYEIYPCLDGTVVLDFTFYNMTIKA